MEHFYKKIEGWAAFADLYVEAVKGAPTDRESTFVEVGSWLGKSAAFMMVEIINSKKPIKFYCVDPWIDGGPDLRDTEHFQKLPNKNLFETFSANLAPVIDHLSPLKMDSLSAADLFEPGEVDFLMLDGDHNYPAVKQEIEKWLPKMRRGGMISGDDYRWPGVTQSVAETIGANHVGVRDVRKDRNYLLSASYWFYRVKA
jgi:hypothetical protein